MSRTKDKEIIINLGLVLAGCLLALIIAEGFLRIALSKDKTDYEVMGKPDPALGYVRNPDKDLFVDENGFKNHATPEKVYLVALGDSFTWGYTRDIKETVEASWPYFLADITDRSVYNMGVGGYGPVQYYALTEKALSFKPKYLLVGFFVGNDFYDAYNMAYNGILMGKNFYEHYGLAEVGDYWKELRSPDFSNVEYETAPEPQKGFKGIRKFIRSHSTLYDFLANSTYNLRARVGLAKIIERVKETEDWKTEGSNISLLYKDNPELETRFFVDEHAYGVDYNDKRIREGIRITFELFDKINSSAIKAGARPIFILPPTKRLLYEKILGDKIKENKLMSMALEQEKDLRIRTFKACREHGLYCIDLLPGMQKELNKGRALYTKVADGHLAPEGYKVIAEIVRNYIK